MQLVGMLITGMFPFMMAGIIAIIGQKRINRENAKAGK